MTRLAFNFRRRRAFTLIEVALAGVAGSVLLASMAYTSVEMRKAATGIYNETQLQTIVRDLQVGLDKNVPAKLSVLTNTNNAKFEMVLSQANGGEASIGIGTLDFNWKDGVAGASDEGGRLRMSTDDGTSWADSVGIGARGMHDQAMFAYKYVETADDHSPPAGAITYYIDERVRVNMLRMTSRMHKDDMLPLYMQAVYAPRALKWSWLDTAEPTMSPTTDSDGDGVMDDEDTYPWDPTRTINGVGGFLPIAVNEGTLAAATIGQAINVFEGGGAGNFGWLTWDGAGSTPALIEMLDDPDSHQYINPNTADDHSLEIGDWVEGNTGISNANGVGDELDEKLGSECIVLVWNQFQGSGNNAAYNTVGFAKITLTGYDLPSKEIQATFLGLCDREGNLLPAIATNTAPTVTTEPGATPVVVATPAPTPAPTATPEAAATASPAASATPVAEASASPSASPTPTPTPTPTPVPADDVYGIMVNDDTFAGMSAGDSTVSLTAGTGNWAWAQWNAGVAEADWGSRLAAPGNSESYTDPNGSGDTHLDIGDYITAETNLDNKNAMKTPLTAAMENETVLVIPLYESITDGKAKISTFAKVQLLDYGLNASDTAKFKYLGVCKQDGSTI